MGSLNATTRIHHGVAQNLNPLFQSIDRTPNQSFHQQQPNVRNSINTSDILNVSHQNVAAAYDMLLKEKLDSTQIRCQAQDLQRQLDRQRRDYSKLLA